MILIPTYNERPHIKSLVRGIRAHLQHIPIVFIDDSSPDGTAEEIRELMQTDPNIHLRMRPKKLGLGSAYTEALQDIVRNNSAPYVITMDGDLSHPTAILPKFIAELASVDMVIGSRYISGGKISNWKLLRRLLSRFANIYARLLTGTGIGDATSGMVAYNTSALKKIDFASIVSEGYAFQIELKYRLEQTGVTYVEVPITFKERENGFSKLGTGVVMEAVLLPWKLLIKKQSFLSLSAVFCVSLAIYALTLPRTIFLNDNAEFITAASILGIPHPSGYPLYVVLAWLFSHIPFGGLVFTINFFSSLCASFALVILTLITRRLIAGNSAMKNWFTACMALAFAVTPMFWFQAIIAKVYTLNLLLLLLLTYISIRYIESKKGLYVYSFALLAGISLTNHLMSALIIPFLALVFIDKYVLRPKRLALALLLFAAGLSIYAYLPLRAAMNPSLNWGNVERGFSYVFNHITRAQYQDLSTQGTIADKLNFIGHFFTNSAYELGPLIIPAALSLFLLLVTKRKFILLLLGIIVGNSILIILLRAIPYSIMASEYFLPYYLPAYAAMVALATVSMWEFFFRYKLQWATLLIAGLCAVGFLWQYLPSRNFSSFTFVEDYSQHALLSLPHNAVLIFGVENAAEDTTLFTYAYHQLSKRLRPDVTIVSYIDVFPQKNNTQVNKAYTEQDILKRHRLLIQYAKSEYPQQPIFSTFPITPENDLCVCKPTGYFFQLTGEYANATAPIEPSKRDVDILSGDYFGKQYLSNYYYQSALFWLEANNTVAEKNFLAAISYDQDPLGAHMSRFLGYRNSLGFAIKQNNQSKTQ